MPNNVLTKLFYLGTNSVGLKKCTIGFLLISTRKKPVVSPLTSMLKLVSFVADNVTNPWPSMIALISTMVSFSPKNFKSWSLSMISAKGTLPCCIYQWMFISIIYPPSAVVCEIFYIFCSHCFCKLFLPTEIFKWFVLINDTINIFSHQKRSRMLRLVCATIFLPHLQWP